MIWSDEPSCGRFNPIIISNGLETLEMTITPYKPYLFIKLFRCSQFGGLSLFATGHRIVPKTIVNLMGVSSDRTVKILIKSQHSTHQNRSTSSHCIASAGQGPWTLFTLIETCSGDVINEIDSAKSARNNAHKHHLIITVRNCHSFLLLSR